MVGQIPPPPPPPHDCCPIQRERVSVSPQSHAFAQADMHVLKTLVNNQIFFSIRDFEVLSFFCCSFYQL